MKKNIVLFCSIIMIMTLLCSCANEEDKAYKAIKDDFEQNNMESVLEKAKSFIEGYSDSKYTEDVNELVASAEKYIADNFEPIEIKYYDGYMGVLDFGAYTGLPLNTSSSTESMFFYTEVKDYMVVNYVRDLKDQGFEEDKDRNLLLSEFGVSTGDTMYLKNSKYSLMLLYAFNTLAISITF